MPVYMVERDLPGIQMEQLAAAQKAPLVERRIRDALARLRPIQAAAPLGAPQAVETP